MKQQSLKKQYTMAFGFSSARLALNYYMFEEWALEEQSLSAACQEQAGSFRKLLESYLDGGDPLDEVKTLRNTMIREMEIITGYTDCFQIYEYALNRLERRFHTDLRAVDEEGIADELMEFITGSNDSLSMNGRIAQVITQLPIRFTRQKFYSMVREALSIYNGADRSSLDNLMYRLRTGAMVDLPEAMEQGYEDLFVILEQFQKLDYKAMDRDGYDECIRKVAYVSDRLHLLSEWYISLQQLINDLYVLLLTKGEAVAEVHEALAAHRILAGLLLHARQTEAKTLPDELIQMLVDLEGMQESYHEKYQRTEAVDKTIDLLLSGSDFVTLQPKERQNDSEETVDSDYLNQTAEAFFESLDQLFAKHQKPVIRAVMAKILSELPVCFNRLDEMQEYIENSFGSCSDSNERETCIDLLRQMMESENALV